MTANGRRGPGANRPPPQGAPHRQRVCGQEQLSELLARVFGIRQIFIDDIGHFSGEGDYVMAYVRGYGYLDFRSPENT